MGEKWKAARQPRQDGRQGRLLWPVDSFISWFTWPPARCAGGASFCCLFVCIVLPCCAGYWLVSTPPPPSPHMVWLADACGYWHSHRAETAPCPTAVSCLIVAYTGSRLISLRWHVTALASPLPLPHSHLSLSLYRRLCLYPSCVRECVTSWELS